MESINLVTEIVKCVTELNFGFFDHINLDDIRQIINVCAELTELYDESHDVRHHVEVFKNAINIINQLTDLLDKKRIIILIAYATLLHDTIDHKYPDKIDQKEQKLYDFLKKRCSKSKADVLWIINNISYSKEIKYGYPQHEDPVVMLARDIVSDADKLEAIGEIGIVRCQQYGISVLKVEGLELDRLVVEHCIDKLLKLMPEFIRTEPGRSLAEPKHQYVLNYVKQQNLKKLTN